MDPQEIAQTVSVFLLPFLIGVKDRVLDRLEQSAANETERFFVRVYRRIRRSARQSEPELDAIVSDAEVGTPEASSAFVGFLENLIRSEPTLATDLTRLLDEGRTAGHLNIVQSLGERSAAVGEKARGVTIITGDDNRVGEDHGRES